MKDRQSGLGDVIRSFGILGVTAFGGPTAHLGYFREEFVARRKWLTERSYADLVALAQFLPGPASSQVGMALGYHRAGWAGMTAAWLMFTAPSTLLLGFFGLLLSTATIDAHQGWISGLLAAAVAVVFHAVAGMARSMANTRLTATIAVLAGLCVLLLPGPLTHVAVILGAGVIGLAALRGKPQEVDPAGTELRVVGARTAYAALVLFFLLLLALPLGATLFGGALLARVAAYIQAGSLVFGGGHVVLPLLEQLTVAPGWVTQEQFLAGYSAAQAVPGPLFTFASFLGAVDGGWLGALVATVAIFLPSALLMTAGLHFWGRWRHLPALRAAFTGANAGVVGLLAAALWDPVVVHGITGVASLSIAALCWLGLAVWKLPPWSIALAAALGGWLLL
ncbi:chromate efflux transporter [Corynebacterium nasicanis]